MAELRGFDSNGFLQVKNVFGTEQIDPTSMARELAIKEAIIVGTPTYQRDVEVAGNTQSRAHLLEFRFLHCLRLDAQADLSQCGGVLSDRKSTRLNSSHLG